MTGGYRDPTAAEMNRTTLLRRLPGGVLVLASATMFTGAGIGFLAPSLREAPPFVTGDVERVAAAIAGNPTAWMWANGLILAAAVVTALALVPISVRFSDAGRPWALTGLVAFGLAAVFSTIGRLITIGVTTWAAERFPDETARMIWEAFDRIRLGTTFYILAFVALGLYGMAMRADDETGLGTGFVITAVVGVSLELVGAAIPGYVYLATAAFGIASWRLDPPEH